MRRSSRSAGVLLLLVLAVVALSCSSKASTESDVYLLTYDLGGDAVPAAEIEGELTFRDQCLWIETGEVRYLALWPGGSEVDDVSSSITIVTPAGDIHTAGDAIHVGGGEVNDLGFLDTLVTSAIPEECADTPAWLITENL